MPLPTAQEYAIEALQAYLEHADIRTTNIGIRTLIIRYVQQDEGTEEWFGEFLGEIDGLFEFLDRLQFIYPGNENINTLPSKS
jgi:hypothetical protein